MKSYNHLIHIVFILILASCGENKTSDHSGHHVHIAPHGGELIELGKKKSEFNLELVLLEQGFLQVYVMDSCAENFVRISATSIDIEVTDENNNTKTILCEPIEDPVTGETIGNTSLFTSTTKVLNDLPISGVIRKLNIIEFTYENIEVNFSGSSKKETE